MLNAQKITVVMPGLDVVRTLARTVEALPRDVLDEVIFVDDGSTDGSSDLARALGLVVVRHPRNLGYGAAQKSGYREALMRGAGVCVMVHPDFQYAPELAPALASMVAYGRYDVALGSRMLDGRARRGGMPAWKVLANRALTASENALLGAHLSEYHTGYRAFSRRALEALPLASNRNDFVFDNEVLAQALHFQLRIGELSCPAHYFEDMSTIHFRAGVRYGLGVVRTAGALALHRAGLASPLFDAGGDKLTAWNPDSF